MSKIVRVLVLSVLALGLAERLAEAQVNDGATSAVDIASALSMTCVDVGAIPVGLAELNLGTVGQAAAITCTVSSNRLFNISGISGTGDGILRNGALQLTPAATFTASTHVGFNASITGATAIWSNQNPIANEDYVLDFAQAVDFGDAPGVYSLALTFTLAAI